MVHRKVESLAFFTASVELASKSSQADQTRVDGKELKQPSAGGAGSKSRSGIIILMQVTHSIIKPLNDHGEGSQDSSSGNPMVVLLGA